MKHITVLKNEAVLALELKAYSIAVDATFGAGGHASLIIDRLGKAGTFVGIDADKTALVLPEVKEKDLPTIHLVNDNFSNLDQILNDLGIKKVDAILADLGWRTDQFEDSGKGFSFQKDEPLQMTFGDHDGYLFTAYDIVNDWEESSLADILYGYGEERYSRRIAKAIVTERKKQKITTTSQLVSVIESAVPKTYVRGRLHFATKTFQALRIAVNDELTVLSKFIDQSLQRLKVGGVLAIITFHSLEDRIVKRRFKEEKDKGEGVILTKKPITPTFEETLDNPRARSAKLRIIRHISTLHECKSHNRIQ